jgi:hypothetical protein
MAEASRLAAELDAVTAALDAAASDAAPYTTAPHTIIERLLKRRAMLIGKLSELQPTGGIQESLLRSREAGERLAAKLSQDRATIRERLGRLHHAKGLLDALRMPAVFGRVDYRA